MKILTIIALSVGLAVSAGGLSYAQGDAPAASPDASQNPAIKSPSDSGPAPLAAGHNSFTKGQAKTRIEKAGYTNVVGLTENADGLWQATAMQNGRTVQVSLDFKGNVASQ
jgi:hypothetical protein